MRFRVTRNTKIVGLTSPVNTGGLISLKIPQKSHFLKQVIILTKGDDLFIC